MNDKSKYLDMFIEEANDIFNDINESLAAMEGGGDKDEEINSLFRGFHSVKGMAASLNLRDIQIVSHKLEDLLHQMRDGTISFSDDLAKLLYKGTATLEKMVVLAEEGDSEKIEYDDLLKEIIGAMKTVKEDSPAPPIRPGIKGLPEELPQSGLAELTRTGKKVFHIEVTVSPDSVSPVARAYLITEELKENSDKLVGIPNQDEQEGWDYGKPIQIFIAADSSTEEIERILKSSIEIEKFSVDEIEVQPASRNGDQEKLCQRESAQEDGKGVIPKYRKPGAVKVETPVLDSLIDIVGEMFIQDNQLLDITKVLKAPDATKSINGLQKLVRKLYKEVMELRLVPITVLSGIIPRVTRELLSNTDKKVEFEVQGVDVRLDRSIVEKLGDPIIHIVRNSLDHGIESPNERRESGKPEKGKLVFSALREKGVITIKISDDGRGLNLEKIKEKVIANGMASREELDGKTDSEIYDYILEPGFSTAEKVTDISGRGVGMDIVRNVVVNLGGKLLVESSRGQGSTFTMHVPLTMAIINTFRININDDIYAIPVGKVIHAIELPRKEMTIENGKMSIEYLEETVPVFDLKAILEYENVDFGDKVVVPILIVETGFKKAGLIVDSFIAGYETVIKPLRPPLEKMEMYTGATISEKGDIILILDTERLLKGVAF
ncbi:MAG: chemotaxis protein CheA [Candidatus Desulfatibia sp.]|uniref:ATP-binding protein n=1 Tax=Candidatus Desulfatibia sp. TaxID=3101189 RepID=UPI002F2D5543